MIKQLICFFVFIFLSFGSIAKTNKSITKSTTETAPVKAVPELMPKVIEIDKTTLPEYTNDKKELRYYDSIFIHYQYSNADSVVYYAKQGLAQFTLHKYKYGVAEMLSQLAGTYSNEGMLDIAKKVEDQALGIYIEIKNKTGIANANNVLGVIDGRKGNYADAEKHFYTALKIYEDVKDTSGISDCYTKLGASNAFRGNLDKSLEFCNMGLSVFNGNNSKKYMDNIIFLNNNIGNIYLKKNDFLNAIKYYQKALDDSKDPAYAQIHILPLTNMGEVCNQMGDKAKALEYEQEALKLAEREHLPENRAGILINIAEIKKDEPGKSIELMKEAYSTSIQIGNKSLEADILEGMIDIYKKEKNYEQAFPLLLRQKELTDSILTIDKERTIANLAALYDVDKLNSKVQQLEFSGQRHQEKENITILISAFIATLMLVLFVYFGKTKMLNNELSRREIQLKKSSATKNKLISIIAHDLIGAIHFTPIAIGLCKDESIPAAEKNALLSQVEMSAVSSYETLQNMLDWGKAQIQGIKLKQVEFEVNEMSDEVLKFTKIAAANKQISIKYRIGSDIVVFADPNHYKFILRNLLSNAIKYSHKNGRIIIDAGMSADASTVVFSVKDSGVGISADNQSAIFESNNESRNGTDNEKGNGIGLQLCREFICENGGKMWVESEIGQGSTFYFSLKAGKIMSLS